MRVFLDTNVLVAAFATRGLCADVPRVVLRHHDLQASEHVLEEFHRVLIKKLRLDQATAQSACAFVRQHADLAAPTEPARYAALTPRTNGLSVPLWQPKPTG